MQSDKEIALQYLDVIESYFVQITILKRVLDANVPDWKPMYEALMEQKGAGARASIRRSVLQLRDQVLEAPDASQIAADILRTLKLPE